MVVFYDCREVIVGFLMVTRARRVQNLHTQIRIIRRLSDLDPHPLGSESYLTGAYPTLVKSKNIENRNDTNVETQKCWEWKCMDSENLSHPHPHLHPSFLFSNKLGFTIILSAILFAIICTRFVYSNVPFSYFYRCRRIYNVSFPFSISPVYVIYVIDADEPEGWGLVFLRDLIILYREKHSFFPWEWSIYLYQILIE
jgi:hypothetical protein